MLVLPLAGLGACHGGGVARGGARDPGSGERREEAAYSAPPRLTSATPEAGGRVRLTGLAAPGVHVRLSPPTGQPLYADADGRGVWRLDLPPASRPRLFGLAMIQKGQVVQSEGYLAITAGGAAAQLRAGAGAVVLGDLAAGPVIDAVDYDSKGGTVVSGRAQPRASLDLFVDGARAARGLATAAGHFSLALDAPQTFAEHEFDVVDGSSHAVARPRLDPSPPLAGGPFRAAMTPSGWRIDWITPGGGLQTTLILNRPGAAV